MHHQINPFDIRAVEAAEADDEDALRHRRPYRQLVCQKQCIQQYIKQQCDCYDETLLRPPSDYDYDYDSFGADGQQSLEPDMTLMCHATDHFPDKCLQQADAECFGALQKHYERVRCAKKTRDHVSRGQASSLYTNCACDKYSGIIPA